MYCRVEKKINNKYPKLSICIGEDSLYRYGVVFKISDDKVSFNIILDIIN